MGIFDIYIAFVSWGGGGKRRPILILEENKNGVTAFNITTRYESKSAGIRAKYFIIKDWQEAGLDRPSYVDTNNTVTFPLSAVDRKTPIGRLTAADERRMIEFVRE